MTFPPGNYTGSSREAASWDSLAAIAYPIPNSSGDSSGVPQRRQMTAEQSPQVKGSVTCWAHVGQ